jgi:hypothetical protein
VRAPVRTTSDSDEHVAQTGLVPNRIFDQTRPRHAGALWDSEDESFRSYSRRNMKRTAVSNALKQFPDSAAVVAPRVLEAISCDEDVSFNRQSIEPVIAVVGRRAVQRYLISVIESGALLERVWAMHAW